MSRPAGNRNQAQPKTTAPPLSKAEQDAIKAAEAITDTESEEYKFALRKEARMLRDSLKEEEQLLAFYQQEREKINYNWIIAKKELEDKRSEQINKDREIQDLKENHIMTLNVYKQKIKHLLFQNQDQQAELKKDVEVTLKQLEDEHLIKNRELKTDNRALKVIKKEQELSHIDYTFALEQDLDRQSTLLRQDYERMANDIKRRYDEKMRKLRAEMEDARANLINKLEAKKDTKIQQIVREHNKKYTDIKNYYSDITASNLELIKQLKNEINQHQGNEENDKKLLQQIEREQHQLKNPLERLKKDIDQYEREYKEQEKVIEEKQRLKQTIHELELRFRKLEYEYEVKLQQYKYLQRERDLLFDKFHITVYEINQKTGLENLILEKKVQNLKEDLEIKDLNLYQTLQAANLDPKTLGALSQSLEEVEALKTELINELQQQLKQIRKAHSHMVKAYEGKLAEFVIPVEELGFDPLVPTNVD
jgi:hypothetical protein